jgi:hypothetical protein
VKTTTIEPRTYESIKDLTEGVCKLCDGHALPVTLDALVSAVVAVIETCVDVEDHHDVAKQFSLAVHNLLDAEGGVH